MTLFSTIRAAGNSNLALADKTPIIEPRQTLCDRLATHATLRARLDLVQVPG